MAGTSYIDPAGADYINQVRRDILATKIALQEPAVFVVLSRLHNDGEVEELEPQEVYRKLNDPTETTATGGERKVTGEYQREEPFDVLEGDHFKTEHGWTGVITAVRPPRAGIVVADFRIDTGYEP